MKKEKYKIIIIIISLAIIDQVIKSFIICNREYLPIRVIKSVLQINYIENYGMAFGMATGRKVIFIIGSLVIIGIIIKFLFTQLKNLSKIKINFLSIIISGGLGNLLDRIFRGYVVDYIDFTQIINFPVFNFADVMIVLGVICFAIVIIKDMINENKEKKKNT